MFFVGRMQYEILSARSSSVPDFNRIWWDCYVYLLRPSVFTLSQCELCRETVMEDLLWIGVMFGLFAASLLYIRLCENA
jgi:hypothetical protein